MPFRDLGPYEDYTLDPGSYTPGTKRTPTRRLPTPYARDMEQLVPVKRAGSAVDDLPKQLPPSDLSPIEQIIQLLMARRA